MTRTLDFESDEDLLRIQLIRDIVKNDFMDKRMAFVREYDKKQMSLSVRHVHQCKIRPMEWCNQCL